MTTLKRIFSRSAAGLSEADEIERNILLTVVNGVLFIFAESLLDPTLVLVAFVSQLTASPFLIGLIVPIYGSASSIPQFWVSGYLQSQPLKIDLYKRMSLIRCLAWGALAAGINLVTDPDWLLVVFFLTFTTAMSAAGISGLPFLEVLSKTVPPARRGETFALRFGVGVLLAIGGSFLVRWMIGPDAPLPFPHNYGLLAIIFFVTVSIALLIYHAVREQPDAIVKPRARSSEQFQRAMEVLRENVNFRRLLTAESAMIVANMATPFFAVFVQKELGGDPAWVAIYLGVTLVTNLLSNLFFGRLSRRIDNQKVLMASAVAGLLMSLVMLSLVLFARPLGISPLAASIWLLPVFVLSGIRTTGFYISSNSLLLNIAPPADRTLMIGFTQTVIGLLLLLTGLSGVLVGVFGYAVLFAVTLTAHLTSLIATRKIIDVKE
ncbi:MAG TPA: MFS transporter [Anaerolineaceae bacterium]|nr:MFS transporter [Anaerolineaceae bacterium]